METQGQIGQDMIGKHSNQRPSLRAMSWNVEGIANTLFIIIVLADNKHCDILCLSERWLSSSEMESVALALKHHPFL